MLNFFFYFQKDQEYRYLTAHEFLRISHDHDSNYNSHTLYRTMRILSRCMYGEKISNLGFLRSLRNHFTPCVNCSTTCIIYMNFQLCTFLYSITAVQLCSFPAYSRLRCDNSHYQLNLISHRNASFAHKRQFTALQSFFFFLFNSRSASRALLSIYSLRIHIITCVKMLLCF